MLLSTKELLTTAQNHNFAMGAFNIYNLEGATAVIKGAEELQSPVMLQLLPSAIKLGGSPLIAMCLEMARSAQIPVGVHLDHCSDKEIIDYVLQAGLTSIMADGSHLEYLENIEFIRSILEKVHGLGGVVEAELGRLSGEEDGLSVDARLAKMTDPDQAVDFVAKTGVDILAVCIGNVHGKYSRPPQLDFERLTAIHKRLHLPLVLHGTSGLPDEMVRKSMDNGVCKFNVNTEIRSKYIDTISTKVSESLATSSKLELVELMQDSIRAMKEPVQAKLNLFCSANKAKLFT